MCWTGSKTSKPCKENWGVCKPFNLCLTDENVKDAQKPENVLKQYNKIPA